MFLGKLLTAIALATVVLIILESARFFLTKRIAARFTPGDAIEIQFISPLLLQFVFLVMLPAVIYAAFYPILPFSGYRSGFFIGLFVFAVGVLPTQIRNYNEFRLSTALVTFQLFWNLLTLLSVMGTITYLYRY